MARKARKARRQGREGREGEHWQALARRGMAWLGMMAWPWPWARKRAQGKGRKGMVDDGWPDYFPLPSAHLPIFPRPSSLPRWLLWRLRSQTIR